MPSHILCFLRILPYFVIFRNLSYVFIKSIDIQLPLRYIVADISQIEKVRSFP